MTVDRDTTGRERGVESVPPEVPTTGGAVRTDATGTPSGVSTVTLVAYTVAGAAILGWFLFGWLVLQQGFVDSVGEAAGAAFTLLLVVSIVGTVRRSRNPPGRATPQPPNPPVSGPPGRPAPGPRSRPPAESRPTDERPPATPPAPRR